MIAVKFKTFGATSAGGSFAPGDIMRCDADLANHLVNEAKCAEYLNTVSVHVEDDTEKPTRRARKSGKD